jgi:hypothetical protein
MSEFYVNSNLTPREVFRLHGALPDSMIEALIDALEDAIAKCEIPTTTHRIVGTKP